MNPPQLEKPRGYKNSCSSEVINISSNNIKDKESSTSNSTVDVKFIKPRGYKNSCSSEVINIRNNTCQKSTISDTP